MSKYLYYFGLLGGVGKGVSVQAGGEGGRLSLQIEGGESRRRWGGGGHTVREGVCRGSGGV